MYRRSLDYLKQQVNLVTPVKQDDGSTAFEPAIFTLPVNPMTCGGGSGLHMSAASYIKLLQVLLNYGVYSGTGKRILQQKTVDLLFTPQITTDEGSRFAEELQAWLRVDQDPFHRSERNGGPSLEKVPYKRRGWGLGSGLTLEAFETGRGAGTLFASGFGYDCCQ